MRLGPFSSVGRAPAIVLSSDPTMTSSPPPTIQARKDTRTNGQRRSFIVRMVRRLFKSLKRNSVDQLKQRTDTPPLLIAPKTKPRSVTKNNHSRKLPFRPVQGARPLKRIAVINQKGGVGKTTTAVNLAGAFAEMGYRTLLLDCDSQGDLSTIFLPGHEELHHSIADIFAGSPIKTKDLIHALPQENLFLIPGDRRLNQFDKTHGYEQDPQALALADALSKVQEDFDLIVFDCAPRAHLSSFAALIAATDVLVPVQPSQFAIGSILTLHQEIESVRTSRNPKLIVRGYFLSMLKPRSPTQKACHESLVQALGKKLVLKTAIPEMATFDTAINLGKPVTIHAPRSKAAQIVRTFALELLGVE